MRRSKASDLTIVDTTLTAPPAPNSASSAAPNAAEDRRRSDRQPANAPGWISGEGVDRSDKGRRISVNDLSMHGVGFHDASGRFRIGAAHWMVVNNGAMRVSTRVKIVSCRESPSGGFDVGATFF